MILGETQQFASPGEALEHHGVKGMRWGHRKEEETGSRTTARINVDTKQKLMTELTKVPSTDKSPLKVDIPKSSGSQITSSVKQREQAADHHGLTPKQKKVLVGLGVTAGVAGFIAYKKYTGQPLIPANIVGFNPATLARRNISKRKVGDLAEGNEILKLWAPEKLHVDLSKGYANITPIAGFANEEAAKRHGDLISELDKMREMYPSVRNMNIEVLPMSHDPRNGTDLIRMNAFAAVMGVRQGEARIYYNDITDKLDPKTQAIADKLFPGMEKPGSLGSHEMGHLLAVAGGRQIPSLDMQKKILKLTDGEASPTEYVKTVAGAMKYSKNQNKLHNDLFKKHGTSFKELSKLSNYAATQPMEGLAELSRYYHGPEKDKLSPELRASAKGIFDELGGVNVDRNP